MGPQKAKVHYAPSPFVAHFWVQKMDAFLGPPLFHRVPFGGGGFLYLGLSSKACGSAGRCVGVPDPECQSAGPERQSAGLERLRAGLQERRSATPDGRSAGPGCFKCRARGLECKACV